MGVDRFTAFAPATVANVGCGFDIFGFALSAPGDTVTARRTQRLGVHLISVEGEGGKLPRETEKNTASVAVLSLYNHVRPSFGIELSLTKGMPLGSGMGSSAASCAAAVYAANQLFDTPLPVEALVKHAAHGETVASGSAHADNVAPSLLGGWILVQGTDRFIRLPIPQGLSYAVVHPEFEIKTSDARKLLRNSIALKVHTEQSARVAGVVAALYTNDLELLKASLHDEIIEPQRSILIPGFNDAREAALSHGALGFSISGAGPSVFALARSESEAKKISSAIEKAFGKLSISSSSMVGAIATTGARACNS